MSIATSELPSTEAPSAQGDPEVENLMYTSMVRPPSLRYSDRKTQYARPGWVSRSRIICYQCYAVDKHVAPECDLDISQLGRLVANYEALSEADREGIPKTAYNMAKQLMQSSGYPEASKDPNKNDTVPKN